ERFPDAWPQHRRYTPARGSSPGAHRYPPRYAPPAARRARRYARVPPMDSGDEPLPMIKRDHADGGPFRRRLTTSTLGVDYFWTPIMAYFSVPIDRMAGRCILGRLVADVPGPGRDFRDGELGAHPIRGRKDAPPVRRRI